MRNVPHWSQCYNVINRPLCHFVFIYHHLRSDNGYLKRTLSLQNGTGCAITKFILKNVSNERDRKVKQQTSGSTHSTIRNRNLGINK